MNKVFIVGVNHCWQQLPGYSVGQPSVEDPRTGLREITGDEFSTFEEFIRNTIRQNSMRTIVEEACGPPHLRMHKLAEKLSIGHQYCELPRADRERRGIKTNADRERHWLGILESVKQFPVLMVCGATHVESFSTLLSASKYEPMLVVSDYEKTLFA
jgi:hypothetical protein